MPLYSAAVCFQHSIMGAVRRNIAACMMALLLINSIIPTYQAIGGRSGGFRAGSTSRPVTGVPVQTARGVPVTRPVTGTPVNTFSSARPATFGGYRYSRPGFRTSPILIGLAAGALTATALSALNNNPNAYCNGVSIVCYKTVCQDALAQCEATNSTTLDLIPCPERRFTECYQSPDTLFQCLGRRRPSFGNEDVQGFCNQQANGASSHKLQLGLMGMLALAAILFV